MTSLNEMLNSVAKKIQEISECRFNTIVESELLSPSTDDTIRDALGRDVQIATASTLDYCQTEVAVAFLKVVEHIEQSTIPKIPYQTMVFNAIQQYASEKNVTPEKVVEGDGHTAKWQRNYPRGRTECKKFPASTTDQYSYDAASDYSETHNYLYTLWRRYECCRKRGKFIKRIG